MNQYPNRYPNQGRRDQRGVQDAQPAKKEHQVLTEENYVDLAEEAIDHLIARSPRNPRTNIPQVVSTSKIRNLLAMTADIYNDAVNTNDDSLPSDIVGRINYLRVRVIYEAGREPQVNSLVDSAQILEHIRDIGNSRKQYILFSRYMESLVAFRKYKIKDKDE